MLNIEFKIQLGGMLCGNVEKHKAQLVRWILAWMKMKQK